MKTSKFNVLFLPQTTPIGASSRARIYAYLPEFERDGFCFTVHAGASTALDSAFLGCPSLLQKIRWFLAQLIGRLSRIPELSRYDCVYLHRETLPYFFPFTELLLRRFAKRIIFDFDDAVFYYPKKPSRLKKMWMDPHSVKRIITAADRVIVSTSYLAEYARRFNQQVVILPTCIRFSDYQQVKARSSGRIVIGWIGGTSTQYYIKQIVEPLKALTKKHDFIFRVIGAQKLDLPGIPFEIRPWSMENEVDDIASFTIGVMPLPDDPWTRGKAGFKLIQYMAAGVPAVGSRVGSNCDIIKDGVNGFLASTTDEWYDKLERLIVDDGLRMQFRERGRQTVKERFSIESNYPLWRDAVTKWH